MPNAPDLQQEEADLEAAVDKFATYMKRRLRLKAALGKRGWRDPQFSVDIADDLMNDGLAILSGYPTHGTTPLTPEDKARLATDIANRAMMIFYFNGIPRPGEEPTQTGGPK